MLYPGSACRLKVAKTLSKRFATPAVAEKYYNSPCEHTAPYADVSAVSPPECTPQLQASAQSHSSSTSLLVTNTDAFKETFTSLRSDEQLELLSELFSLLVRQSSVPILPSNFLELVVKGMKRLHDGGRSNVIYLLAKALGTTRSDGSDSLLPVSRMPMGLLEYMVNFFTASSTNKVFA